MMLYHFGKKTKTIAGIVLFGFLLTGCIKKTVNEQSLEVDSMKTVVISILDSINSHNIQEFHEVWQKLNNDLDQIYDSMNEDMVNSTLTSRYVSLFSDVHSCVLACNSYHEEIFLIEGGLQELHELIRTSDISDDSINTMIRYESELVKDLLIRIDTNLDKINGYIKSFYELKPQMDSLFIASGFENAYQ